MASSNTSALNKAMNGDKVTDRQAKGALSQAVDKISSLTKRAQKSKEAMAETGAMVVHTAETQGSLFLSSMAEGYFGSDKLKIGSVDIRAPVGLLAQGYGLYEAMSGKGSAAGHALALGNGVMGSWLASVAVSAGRTLAEKRAGGAPAPAPDVTSLPAPVQLTPSAVQGLLPPPPPVYDPVVQGPVREVLLTPEGHFEGDDDFEGPRRVRGRRGGGGGGGRRWSAPRGGQPEEDEHGPRGRHPRRRRMRQRMRQRFLRAHRQDDELEPELDEPADSYFDDDNDRSTPTP
ncbi:MAG: hypothetical protein H6738_24465 [Alphaproteobacteria bacterium]|nr:hypothetical protein [Alphaproteobacteria bacterium]MCB9699964.1 hypothetical protein [Alphaproteobacteria bacterium]